MNQLQNAAARTTLTSTDLLDVPVHSIDTGGVLKTVIRWIDEGLRPSKYITQTNVHSVVTARRNEIYKQVLQNASLSVPDGMPLVWLLRRGGNRTSARVYGPDLMLMMCEEASRRGWRCFLYGGNPGVPELLQGKLHERWPDLKIVGKYSPPFRALTDEEDQKVCEMINATRPDILWVGLGSPKQDIWMYEHREKLDVSVMHGVGAAFDFLSGRTKQAPRWMMNAGFEWLFRLMMEPKRLWKRYTINNLLFLYYLFLESLGLRRPR